jgi:hypothetical protein
MAHLASVNFVDKDSGQPGFVAVRVEGRVVGLAVSLQDNGDIEIFLDRDETTELIEALEQARAASQ